MWISTFRNRYCVGKVHVSRRNKLRLGNRAGKPAYIEALESRVMLSANVTCQLSGPPSPIMAGAYFDLTATLNADDGTPLDGYHTTLYEGTQSLQDAVISDGTAHFHIKALTGQHVYHAQFVNDQLPEFTG